jgi:hypothetical protein
MNIELQSMAIDLPPFAAHPNRAPFRGVLTLVDTPSDSAPSGADGHRVLLTRAAAEQALPSLLGMALDYAPSLDRHDARRKVGIITEANIVGGRAVAAVYDRVAQSFGRVDRRPHYDSPLAAEGSRTVRAAISSRVRALLGVAAATAGLPRLRSGPVPASSIRLRGISSVHAATGHWPLTTDHSRASALEVAGYLYARDFPDVMRELEKQCGPGLRPGTAGPSPAPHALGMSYEITDARIADSRAAVWTVTEFTFTGAAMLRRDRAAYRDTWIELIG